MNGIREAISRDCEEEEVDAVMTSAMPRRVPGSEYLSHGYARAMFQLGDELQAELDSRRPRDQTYGLLAKRDLARYYGLLRAELATIKLTLRDATDLVNAFKGTGIGVSDIQTLWALLADRADSSLARRVREKNRGQLLALLDATERYWNAGGKKGLEAFRAVGFFIKD